MSGIAVEPRLLQAEDQLSADEILSLEQYVAEGELEPAIVVEDGEEALAAVACQKADAVIHVRFSPAMTRFLKDNYSIEKGSRLIAINNYSEALPKHSDLMEFAQSDAAMSQVHPIIAETVAASPEQLQAVRASMNDAYGRLIDYPRQKETRFIRRATPMQSHKVVDTWEHDHSLQLVDPAELGTDADVVRHTSEKDQQHWQAGDISDLNNQAVKVGMNPWIAYPCALICFFVGGVIGLLLMGYVAENGFWKYTPQDAEPILGVLGLSVISFPAFLLPLLFFGGGRRLIMSAVLMGLALLLLLPFYKLATDVVAMMASYEDVKSETTKAVEGAIPYVFLILIAQIFGGLLTACGLIGFARLFNKSGA